jgi:hypothetical protein
MNKTQVIKLLSDNNIDFSYKQGKITIDVNEETPQHIKQIVSTVSNPIDKEIQQFIARVGWHLVNSGLFTVALSTTERNLDCYYLNAVHINLKFEEDKINILFVASKRTIDIELKNSYKQSTKTFESHSDHFIFMLFSGLTFNIKVESFSKFVLCRDNGDIVVAHCHGSGGDYTVGFSSPDDNSHSSSVWKTGFNNCTSQITLYATS